LTTDSTDPQLRRNSLGLPELVFQGVTHIAPATNMIFTFPIIALKAGPDMPLSFLLATTVCFFIGNTVSQFSRYMPSSGSYYSFTTRGLGNRVGFMAAWSYLAYDIIGAAGSTGFLGYLLSEMFRTGLQVNLPWWLIAMVIFGGVWALTHYGIQLSPQFWAAWN
jgi:amino acid transporter